ncbi:MAG: hypothetical protein ABWY54_06300 [Glaciihabitans sp.]
MTFYDSRPASKVDGTRTGRDHSGRSAVNQAILYSALLAASTAATLSLMLGITP